MIVNYHITKKMGFLDNIFKREKEEQEQEKQVPEKRIIDQCTIPSKEEGIEIYMHNITREGNIRHRNNELTELIMARIAKYKTGDTIFDDDFEYIGFEIPSGQTLDENIIQAVMEAYDMITVRAYTKTYYMGRVEEGENSCQIGNKSAAVEKMILDIVEKSEHEKWLRDEAKAKAKETSKQAEEAEFREELKESARRHEEEIARTRNERRQAPTLKQDDISKIKGKEEYDGVNLRTGDILRIRKVNMLERDTSGTYLYSAYLDNTFEKSDVEFLDEEVPSGVPVCFTLPRRLADMVQEGDNKDIQSILTLLSGIDTKSIKNMQQISYLGGITENGDVSRAGIEATSAIGRKILEIRADYRKQLEERKQKQAEEQKGN